MSGWVWRWLARRLQPILAGMQESGAGAAHDAPHPPPAEPSPAATEDELRRLMGLALSTPTPDAVMAFVDFTSRTKRLAPFNMWMVYAQRPGARAVASEKEWAAAGQTVRPDAIPILVLKHSGPIAKVFELLDTVPQRDRDPRTDAFAATGPFDPARLTRLIDQLENHGKRQLKVQVVQTDYGAGLAGRITRFGLFSPAEPQASLLGSGDPASATEYLGGGTYWRVTLNRRLTPAEQFATLLHELGHLFCGHLGGFDAENPAADEYGWPDRRKLPLPAREIEAELVAWHMCEREGLATGSPVYLRGYLERAGDAVGQVDLDRVIRAIARIRAYLGDPS